MTYINYNGKILSESDLHLSPSNRSFRYADGFFETIRLVKGKPVLGNLHLERLYTSLETMKFEAASFPEPNVLLLEVLELVIKNNHEEGARIRITVFGGNGALKDFGSRKCNYIIEAFSLATPFQFNEKGLEVDFYTEAVKPCDKFSSLKSNNFLPYVMASLWANERGLDDGILLNPYQNVADATTTNVFIIKDGYIKTPSLLDGCVNGVMRRYLLQCIKQEGMPFAESSVSQDDVLQASEVFLTNAIVGISWVEKVGSNHYTNQMSSMLFNKFITRLTD